MRMRAWMLVAPALFGSLAVLGAEKSQETPPTWTVGSVYGKVITAADIGLSEPIDPAIQFDARDTARWKLMQRIRKVFGSPVVERFVEREKIAATPDEKIRAFDKYTGKVLWEHQLPAGGYATPSVYEINGRQFVVIAAGGGGKLGTRYGESILAFALPKM